MMSSEEFFRSPAARAFFQDFLDELLKRQRPPAEKVIDDVDLCKELNISKRYSATLRAEGVIPYSKDRGKIWYIWEDVLNYIRKYRIEEGTQNNAICNMTPNRKIRSTV